jgi:hypothetical protein
MSQVFIDYGKAWEDSWNEHVDKWNHTTHKEEEDFLSIKELNEKQGPLSILVSGDLRKRTTDHPNVFTGCAYWSTDKDFDDAYRNKNPDWRELPDDDILKLYADSGAEFLANYTSHQDQTYWPCSVVIPENDTHYTVRMDQPHFEEQMPWDANNVPRFLTNYPRSSIHYFRQPYTSDQHLPQAFRHLIGIPDEMFPGHWKNRRMDTKA